MANEAKIYRHSTNVSRIAAELYEGVPPEKAERAFHATKDLMNTMKLKSLLRQDKIELARERIRTGYYNRKDVLSKIANEILKDFDLG